MLLRLLACTLFLIIFTVLHVRKLKANEGIAFPGNEKQDVTSTIHLPAEALTGLLSLYYTGNSVTALNMVTHWTTAVK